MTPEENSAVGGVSSCRNKYLNFTDIRTWEDNTKLTSAKHVVCKHLNSSELAQVAFMAGFHERDEEGYYSPNNNKMLLKENPVTRD
jgi:hypothetical protein